ncbi:MAG: sulfatase [Putridiphycobacter sp.]|nr:sulfatase [Putridiphycobacter sp.]
MVKRLALSFTLLVVLVFSITSFNRSHSVKKNKYKTKHVIILVLDGPRWSETYGDSTFKNVSRQHEVLIPQGVFFNNFSNDGPTYTNSGHTALTTGIYQRVENTGKELPKKPSIFQYYLKQYKADKRKAWVMTSKGKLDILAYTKDKDWERKYYPSSYCGTKGSGTGYPNDVKMFNIFVDLLKTHRPAITLINLLEIDAWAHQKRWDRYISSLKQNDSLAVELWRVIQSDSLMKDQTTLFITNDHGRHLDHVKDGYVSHGDRCSGCTKISLIGLGPDFKSGVSIDNPRHLLDVNATAAELLHIDMPTAKGEVIWEMFKPSFTAP